MATTTYLLITPDMEEEIEAASLWHARQVARERILAAYPPRGTSPYWVHATLRDAKGEVVRDWVEVIDPEVPECDPPAPELERATVDELQRVWGAYGWPEDGHVWASPYRLVGGSLKEPGIFPHLGAALIRDVCLRCGTVRSDATFGIDPETGMWGLGGTEYEVGRHADQVKSAYLAVWAQEGQR